MQRLNLVNQNMSNRLKLSQSENIIERLKLDKDKEVFRRYDFLNINNFKKGDLFYGVFIQTIGNNIVETCKLFNNSTDIIKFSYAVETFRARHTNTYTLWIRCNEHKNFVSNTPEICTIVYKSNIKDNYDNKMYIILKCHADVFLVCFISEDNGKSFIDNFDKYYRDELTTYIENNNLTQYA